MNTLQQQFQDMIQSGKIPVLEYKQSNGDWLTVDIEVTDRGFEFSADFNNLPCFFDGQIIGSGNFWILPYDTDLSLDSHLQLIDQNIVDGFLIANNLYDFEK